MLIIGDPHVRPDNLQESEKLLEFVEVEVARLGEKNILILGDLFHTHGVIRMEVQSFWMRWAERLGKKYNLVILHGNHDGKGDDQSEGVMSALDPLKGIFGVTIVDTPTILGDFTFLPYTASLDKFTHWVSEANTPFLVCHQTFDGGQYENGFYAKDGLPTSLVAKFKQVISGHIHKTQEFANIWYPGTPRWDSVSDANESKGLWTFSEYDHRRSFIPTDSVCSKIISIELSEGQDLPDIVPGTRTHVKLTGSSSWIAKTAKKLKGKARVSSKPTDARFSGEIKQLSSFESYANQFKFEGVSKEEVLDFLRGLL
jgi:hypothetical protein